MTDRAPDTRPAWAVFPETRPTSLVHPSWGVRLDAEQEDVPVASGATALRHGAHADPTDADDDEPRSTHTRLGTTALVTVIAMVCMTTCVAIVALFGDPRGGAVLTGLFALVGAGMACLFRDRWR